MTSTSDKAITRRAFVKGSGSLVVGFSLAGTLVGEAAGATGTAAGVAARQTWPIPPINQVDSFLEILADGTVIAKFGKGMASQGTTTGILQMYADELDVPFSSVKMIAGDSALTPNQKGASGSDGTSTEWTTIRQVAATARQQLLSLASSRLGVPVANLTVKDGVVSGTGTSQTVTYGQLIGGQSFNLTISPTAPQKTPAQFTVMGTPQQRREIPEIVTGRFEYAVDVRLPGMLHARNIRPPVAGATLVSINGPHNLPGLVKVVAKGNYLAVVAQTEWQAIQASHALNVTWKPPTTPPFPNGYGYPNLQGGLYQYLTSATPQTSSVTKTGDAPSAIANAAKVVAATYQIDFQSHSTVGPYCAVGDYKNGGCTVYFGGEKPYPAQSSVANTLSTLIDPAITPNNVRAVWVPQASSFGRSEADDVVHEAAYLSAVVGAPVRVQWSREESTAWDPKGPAAVITVQGGLDANDKVVGWNWTSYAISGTQIPSTTGQIGDTLMGNLMGYMNPTFSSSFMSNSGYGYPNTLVTSYNMPWSQTIGTGLRSSHLRAPGAIQTGFASEQFEDELAVAAGLDPINFRLTYLPDPRAVRVLQTVAKAAGWVSRVSPNAASSSKPTVVSGRGVGIVGTLAHVVEVEVNRKNGNVHVSKVTTAHDNGFVINPLSIVNAIKAGNMHAINRSTMERVAFDSSRVTTVDWVSYPILDIKYAPEMNVVTVAPDGIDPSGVFTAPSGAGEGMQGPMAAAIANAVFDATGVRVRRMPLTPDVVLAALSAAGKAVA